MIAEIQKISEFSGKSQNEIVQVIINKLNDLGTCTADKDTAVNDLSACTTDKTKAEQEKDAAVEAKGQAETDLSTCNTKKDEAETAKTKAVNDLSTYKDNVKKVKEFITELTTDDHDQCDNDNYFMIEDCLIFDTGTESQLVQEYGYWG